MIVTAFLEILKDNHMECLVEFLYQSECVPGGFEPPNVYVSTKMF